MDPSSARLRSSAPVALPPAAAEVLDFWFAGQEAPREIWFRKSSSYDALVRERFAGLIEQALADQLGGWTARPDAALAQVLLLDQFTRNVFRDTPRAFAGDALALAAAQGMCARGDDLALAPVQRVFVYLPFEHAEDAAMQAESLRRFEALAQAHPGMAGFLDYARRHAEVIRRFGRFPHRNAILGRASTPEEIEFLQQPGSSF